MSGLFEWSDRAVTDTSLIDGRFPVITVDGVFRDPNALREAALALPYAPASTHYPGRLARFPSGDQSLAGFLQSVVSMVEANFLPALPPLPNGRRVTRIRSIESDFAITDVPPDRLSQHQRKPHVDPAPIFGLAYLNPTPRGGTLFFRAEDPAMRDLAPAPGYPGANHDGLRLVHRIEGRFNRLAIYPGFVLHSGEIAGDWISSEERTIAPRLTQRIQFFV